VGEPSQRLIEPPAQVAFIGLGNMGQPMAARLIEAGFRVCGLDNTVSVRKRFEAETGGTASDNIEAAVSSATAVVTMLPTGKVVRAVVESMHSHLRPGTVIVDMSSSEPIATRKLGEQLIEAGYAFVDAPVSGGVKRAIDGTPNHRPRGTDPQSNGPPNLPWSTCSMLLQGEITRPKLN
jgi:3-hydroxyisobutyrate dehydrogenase